MPFQQNLIIKKSLCNATKSLCSNRWQLHQEEKNWDHNPYGTDETLRLRLSLSKVFSRSTDFSRLQTEESPENKLEG